MKIRKLPFGYKMQNGQIQAHEQEAPIVRLIYTEYAKGASYRILTETLNKQPVFYNQPGQPWNKNMVGRILNNKVYLGTDSYPPLISNKNHVLASTSNPWRSFQKVDEESKHIRRLSTCPECSAHLEFSNGFTDWVRWKCPVCDNDLTNKSMDHIKKDLMAILNSLIDYPEQIQVPPKPDVSSPSPLPEEALFQDQLDASDFDEMAATQATLRLTARRFNAIGSEEYETSRIIHLITSSREQTSHHFDLLLQITQAILIYPNGSVGIKLKNNQIIIGGD